MILHPVLIPIPDDARLDRPRRRQRQREYARRALGHCAGLSAAPSDGWSQDDADVPLPNNGFYWSISHKPRWAAAVIANQPVGIDIECVAPRRDGMFDMIGSAAEWRLLGGRTWELFYRLFTAKEATLKANGVGIGSVRDCVLTELCDDGLWVRYADRDWRAEPFRHAGHTVAVAVSAAQALRWHVADAVA